MNASQWIAALCATEGTEYVELRDALLKDSSALADFLAQKKPTSASDTSISAVQYEIILGWKNNSDSFKQYLAEIDSINFDIERKTATGVAGVWRQYATIAKEDYGVLILPLCWEVLLKYGKEWDSLVMNIFLTAVEYIPNIRSVEPLLRYMEATTDLPQHRFAGTKLGYLVSSLPDTHITERLEIAKLKKTSIIEGIDEALEVIRSEEERNK